MAEDTRYEELLRARALALAELIHSRQVQAAAQDRLARAEEHHRACELELKAHIREREREIVLEVMPDPHGRDAARLAAHGQAQLQPPARSADSGRSATPRARFDSRGALSLPTLGHIARY